MLGLPCILWAFDDFGLDCHANILRWCAAGGAGFECVVLTTQPSNGFRVLPLYFAYGSNMQIDAMAARCPRSTPLGNARLARHRFALTSQGFATVARDPRADVWGMLWALAFADVSALDRYEEVARGLYVKQTSPVIRAGASAVQALIFIARAAPPGPAAPASYGEGVVRAAHAAGLPPAYCATVASAFAGTTARSRA